MADSFLKKLERRAKALTLAAVERLFPRRRLPIPDWDARPWRVLYLRYDRIGDMIIATGLLRAIAQAHPTIELHVLASPGNVSVLEGNPHVDQVLIFDRRRKADFWRTLRALRRGRYDAVIDGAVTAPSVTTMLLMLATRAPYRIGLSGRPNDAIYTLPVAPGPPGSLVLEESARTVTPFGLALDGTDWRSELFLRPDEMARAETLWRRQSGTPRILVNVSAVTGDRRWPTDRFEALAAQLRRLAPGARVLVTGSPADWSISQRVAAAGGWEAVNVSPVREAFALVAAADALLTPDTAVSHCAAAVGTPMAVMFRGDWLRHTPYRAANLISIVSDGSALADLPVERVAQALPGLLELARQHAQARAGQGGTPARPPGSAAM